MAGSLDRGPQDLHSLCGCVSMCVCVCVSKGEGSCCCQECVGEGGEGGTVLNGSQRGLEENIS